MPEWRADEANHTGRIWSTGFIWSMRKPACFLSIKLSECSMMRTQGTPSALLWNLNNHLLFPLSRKGRGFPRFPYMCGINRSAKTTGAAINSSTGRPSRPLALLRLSTLMAEIICLRLEKQSVSACYTGFHKKRNFTGYDTFTLILPRNRNNEPFSWHRNWARGWCRRKYARKKVN